MLRASTTRHRIAPAHPNKGHIGRVRCRPNPTVPEMLRICLLTAAAALLSATLPVAAQQSKASSWSSEKMRLAPPPRPVPPGLHDELEGNCAGLTVTIKTRIERLKALQDQASGAQWPPPSWKEQWARRPLDGDIARQREQVARLNRALGAKGCETVDVSAELKRAPAAKTTTTTKKSKSWW
jgi:hypothetical protein